MWPQERREPTQQILVEGNSCGRMEDFSLFYLYYPGLHLLGGISLSLKKLLLKFSSYHLKYRYTSWNPSAGLCRTVNSPLSKIQFIILCSHQIQVWETHWWAEMCIVLKPHECFTFVATDLSWSLMQREFMLLKNLQMRTKLHVCGPLQAENGSSTIIHSVMYERLLSLAANALAEASLMCLLFLLLVCWGLKLWLILHRNGACGCFVILICKCILAA